MNRKAEMSKKAFLAVGEAVFRPTLGSNKGPLTALGSEESLDFCIHSIPSHYTEVKDRDTPM